MSAITVLVVCPPDRPVAEAAHAARGSADELAAGAEREVVGEPVRHELLELSSLLDDGRAVADAIPSGLVCHRFRYETREQSS